MAVPAFNFSRCKSGREIGHQVMNYLRICLFHSELCEYKKRPKSSDEPVKEKSFSSASVCSDLSRYDNQTFTATVRPDVLSFRAARTITTRAASMAFTGNGSFRPVHMLIIVTSAHGPDSADRQQVVPAILSQTYARWYPNQTNDVLMESQLHFRCA